VGGFGIAGAAAGLARCTTGADTIGATAAETMGTAGMGAMEIGATEPTEASASTRAAGRAAGLGGAIATAGDPTATDASARADCSAARKNAKWHCAMVCW
jgi:hypothetical protein